MRGLKKKVPVATAGQGTCTTTEDGRGHFWEMPEPILRSEDMVILQTLQGPLTPETPPSLALPTWSPSHHAHSCPGLLCSVLLLLTALLPYVLFRLLLGTQEPCSPTLPAAFPVHCLWEPCGLCPGAPAQNCSLSTTLRLGTICPQLEHSSEGATTSLTGSRSSSSGSTLFICPTRKNAG